MLSVSLVVTANENWEYQYQWTNQIFDLSQQTKNKQTYVLTREPWCSGQNLCQNLGSQKLDLKWESMETYSFQVRS